MNQKKVLKTTDYINISLFTWSYYIALTHFNVVLLIFTEIFFLWWLKGRAEDVEK